MTTSIDSKRVVDLLSRLGSNRDEVEQTLFAAGMKDAEWSFETPNPVGQYLMREFGLTDVLVVHAADKPSQDATDEEIDLICTLMKISSPTEPAPTGNCISVGGCATDYELVEFQLNEHPQLQPVWDFLEGCWEANGAIGLNGTATYYRHHQMPVTFHEESANV